MGVDFFGFETPDNWVDLTDNCGVGIVNADFYQPLESAFKKVDLTNKQANTFTTDKQKNNYLKKMAVFCGACAPGFKPTYHANNKYIVETCTEIKDNTTVSCQGKDAFNSCTKCAPGYAFKYADNSGATPPKKQVHYDECVAVPAGNEQCFAWDTATPPKCQFCHKGHFKNKDGICERIDPPACERGNYSPEIAY